MPAPRHLNRLALRLVGGAALALVAGCDSYDPDEVSLFQNATKVFEDCNRSKIKFLTDKHNLMAAFRYCGSNNFAHYTWNPSGSHMYFDLTHTGNLLDASVPHKPMTTLPIERPIGQATWLTDNRLAIPVRAATGDKTETPRVALYDIAQRTLEYRPLEGLTEPDDLQLGDSPSEVLLTAKGPQGDRTVYRLDLDTGTIDRPFGWLTGPADTLSYTPAARSVVIGFDNTVTLYDRPTGMSMGYWTPANRGTLHPDGQYLALEHEGDRVSVFYQRTWNELPERARKLEEQKAQRLADKLPDWYPTHVNLPTLSIVDLKTQARWAVTSFYGTRFQWYPTQDFYASFMLWGYEGTQFNRNVMLGNLAVPIYRMEKGQDRKEIHMMDPPVPVSVVESAGVNAAAADEAKPTEAPEKAAK